MPIIGGNLSVKLLSAITHEPQAENEKDEKPLVREALYTKTNTRAEAPLYIRLKLRMTISGHRTHSGCKSKR